VKTWIYVVAFVVLVISPCIALVALDPLRSNSCMPIDNTPTEALRGPTVKFKFIDGLEDRKGTVYYIRDDNQRLCFALFVSAFGGSVPFVTVPCDQLRWP
jgi:hypothetical protein